jgi:2-polyprenyl-6-methoxyphenol hydroxylase-like FAD-dependent oxidoreductase
MGIEDAVVLAECLDAEPDFDTAASAFMQRRHARVRTVLEASIAISRAQMCADGAAEMAMAQRVAAEALALPF